VNEAFEALKTAVIFLLSLVVSILAYFAKRTSERVDELKETAVTRTELTAALDRIESRQHVRHGENRDLLERIVAKIDANEERASRTRHDTNESVHALAVRLAAFSRTEGER
jgi:hypothetical protein